MLTVRLGVAIPDNDCLALIIGLGVVALPVLLLLVLAASIDRPSGFPGVLGVAALAGRSASDASVAAKAFCAASCLAFVLDNALARPPTL